MRENVIIAYRGASYELGQWPYGYGIWSASSQEPLPIEWWDPTPDGWSAAWYRFAALEVPGTINAVSQPGGGQLSPLASAQPGTTPVTPVTPAATVAPATSVMPAMPVTPATAQTPAAAVTPPTSVMPGQPAGIAPAPAAATRPAPFFGPPAGPLPGEPPVSPVQAAQAPGDPAPAKIVRPQTARIAAGLLALGVALGVAGLFPVYLGGKSLASQGADLWPHLVYLASWAVSAILIFRAGRLARPGALLATGASVVTFGLFLADAGYPIEGGTHLMGTGLVLSVLSWAVCAVGSLVAFGRWPADWPRRPLGPEAGVAAALVAAAIGVAATFAPAWDKITLPTGVGITLSETATNAFSNPAAVIVGDVAVMLAVVAVVAVAVLWRPVRLGWALIAGAMIQMAAQVVSALVQFGGTTTAAQLDVTPAVAAQLGISTSQLAQNSPTAVFWFYCLFVVVSLIACAWLALGRDKVVPAAGGYGYGYGSPAGYGPSGPPVMAGAWPAAPAAQAAPGTPNDASAPAGFAEPPQGDISGPAGS